MHDRITERGREREKMRKGGGREREWRGFGRERGKGRDIEREGG